MFQVKARAMELAVDINNEDGVRAAVEAFHRHLAMEHPLPTPSLEKRDCPNPVQWLFRQVRKLCCLPPAS